MTLDPPAPRSAQLALVVLQADQTIEGDFRRLFPDPTVALHVTRVPSGLDVTPDTLAAMEAALPQAARLLPRGADYGAVGYACTSGASVIGSDRVAALIRGAAPAAQATDPLEAAAAALARLGARRIAVVSPYVPSVGDALAAAFAARGVTVAATRSFAISEEARVVRIPLAQTRDAALALAADPGVQAVFLSCTNLRTLDLLAPLETALGKPVLSSNAALAWRMARLAGAPPPSGVFGRLMAL